MCDGGAIFIVTSDGRSRLAHCGRCSRSPGQLGWTLCGDVAVQRLMTTTTTIMSPDKQWWSVLGDVIFMMYLYCIEDSLVFFYFVYSAGVSLFTGFWMSSIRWDCPLTYLNRMRRLRKKERGRGKFYSFCTSGDLAWNVHQMSSTLWISLHPHHHRLFSP